MPDAARPIVAVAHSPTPSTVITAAESNSDGKYALAACERWWSAKTTRSRGTPVNDASRPVIPWRSVSQARIERTNASRAGFPIAAAVVSTRLNLTFGFS